MKLRIAVAAVAVLASAQSAVAQTPYEVVRVGDAEMTCEALASSINATRAEAEQAAERARQGAERRQAAGRAGRGLLAGLARGAASMGYGGALGDGMGGAVAAQVLGSVANEVANAPAPAAPAPAAPAVSSPQQQRVAHLTAIFTGRPC